MNSHKYLLLLAVAISIITPSATGLLRGNYCWQMIPVLGAASILMLVAGLGQLKLIIATPWLFPASIGLGLIGVITSAILSYLYPIFTLPVPTGRYAVGTISIDLVDKSRIELCDPTTTTANRELVVRVWYPTISNNNSPKTAYIEDPRLIPSGLFSHLGLVKTHASQAAPMATMAAPYPTIIYTPSWSGFKTDNTFQTQELASHGYIVIGLEHACSVPIAIYPSGRVIRSNLAADYTSSDAAMAKFLNVARSQLDLRTQDVRFILDRLPELNTHQLLKGNLNLDKIGIFGHSFGGAVAAQACSIDARLKAGLNMDGLMFGSSAQQGATQPFLFMNSDYPRPTAAELRSENGSKRRGQQTDEWGFQQRERWFQQHGGYNLTLLGAAHMSFSDYPLRSRFGNGGSKISPERAMQIVNRYTVAFFDRYLKEIDSPLLAPKSVSPFPEVIFQNFGSVLGFRF
jgi:predicted dienelactone hydrolase